MALKQNLAACAFFDFFLLQLSLSLELVYYHTKTPCHQNPRDDVLL